MFCDACRLVLNSLPYDAESTPSPLFGALTTLLWPDELPGGRIQLRCGASECRNGFQNLLATRTALWIHGAVPDDERAGWNQAREQIADWPGFQRLVLDETSRRAFEALLGQSLEFLRTLTQEADRVVLGEGEITYAYDLSEEE